MDGRVKGGVLFALEEAITHFDAKLIVRIYFICIISYYIYMILEEGARLNTDRFTEYHLTSGCNTGYDAEDILLFGVLGAVGGLFGGTFNAAIMALSRWRQVAPSPPFKSLKWVHLRPSL